MPDLILSEDQKQYQELAADFARNEVSPQAHNFDLSGEFPEKLLRKAWEIGLINVRFPEAIGGLGLSLVDASVMTEELAAACAGITATIWGNDLATAPLLVAATAQQQQRFLAPLTEEFLPAAYCFGSGAAPAALTYNQKGGELTIKGRALAINARHAPWLLIKAASGDDPEKIATIVIPADCKGIRIGERMAALGLRAADLTEVEFSGASVSIDNMIGAPNDLQACAEARLVSSVLFGSVAVGIMRSAMQNAIAYSQQRHTMGVPIAQHQAVAFMLADMAKDTEAARFMLRKCAWLADAGEGDVLQAAAARNLACEAASRAACDAVQVFGGYGYSREYPVEKLMRDAKMLQVFEYSPAADRIAQGRELVRLHR
jgi:acyl-CoA dehydrogenase